MVRYIKANPKVVDFLHLKESRNPLKDGNYILWQGDMLAFGPLTQLNDILTQIGAIALTSHEARQEQDGSILRPLPTATDPRFVVETAQNSLRATRRLRRHRRKLQSPKARQRARMKLLRGNPMSSPEKQPRTLKQKRRNKP